MMVVSVDDLLRVSTQSNAMEFQVENKISHRMTSFLSLSLYLSFGFGVEGWIRGPKVALSVRGRQQFTWMTEKKTLGRYICLEGTVDLSSNFVGFRRPLSFSAPTPPPPF